MKNEFTDSNLKKIKEYNCSIENLKKCEFFEQLNQKYVILQKQYMNTFQMLNDDIMAKAHRREFSKGGLNIHRGFYSPSSLDLVVGGCNRGRLIKKISSSSKYDYEYIFDSEGKMICAKKYTDQFEKKSSVVEIELFVYEQNSILSLIYEPYLGQALTFISKCLYEKGHLYRYESVICEPNCIGESCLEINIEEIGYEKNLMKTVLWSRYNPIIRLLDKNRYTFERDKDGYLLTYTVEQLNEFAKVQEKKQVYNVRLKRK